MKLSLSELTYLADRFPNASTISLFTTRKSLLKGDESAKLEAKGVLKNGTLSSAAQQTLEILAKAKQAARLLVRDGLTVLELYAYRVGDDIAFVENQGTEMLIRMPEDFTALGHDIAQYIGTSARKTTGLEIALPETEAMTLLALIDVYRNWTLRSYLGLEVGDAVTAKDIEQHMQANGDSSLVDLFRTSFGYENTTGETLIKALDSLISRGLVTSNEGYRLNPEYALFAKNFLVPATSILVESFSIDSTGQLKIAGGLGLTAGVCDQVFFLVDESEMELKTVAGLEMLQMIEGFLACPELG